MKVRGSRRQKALEAKPGELTRTRIREIAGVAALLALTGWVFSGCLQNPFHFDDYLFLESPHVANPGDLRYLILNVQPRQLAYLSFFLNYRLAGGDPSGYHLVNLLLHLGNVLGMYCFVRLLIHRASDLPDPLLRRWLPLAAAAVFALHPIQSEVVNYVYQRSTLLAALFTLAALCAFLKSGREGVPGPFPFYLLTVIFFLFAVASKETALALPLVLLVYLWAYARSSSSLKSPFIHARWLLIPLGVLMSIGVLGALLALYRSGEGTIGFGVVERSSLRYMVSQTQVIVNYLRLLLWPSGLSIDHDPFIAPWTSPHSWLCALIIVGLVSVVPWLRKALPTASFALLVFFIFLSPTSSFIPSADLMFEHRLYLPMITASILLALGVSFLARLAGKTEQRQQAARVVLLGILLIAYSAASRERTFVWGDNVRLWEDAAAKAPGKLRPHYNLGVLYLDASLVRAQEEFTKVLELHPGHAPSLHNLGWLSQKGGQYDLARKYYRATLVVDPRYWQAHRNLGNLALLEGKNQEAMHEFQETIRLQKDYWPAYLSLGTLRIQQGEFKDARSTLETLKQLRPDLLEGRYLLAYALIEEGLLSRAEEELRALSSKDRDNNYKERIEELRQRMRSKQLTTEH